MQRFFNPELSIEKLLEKIREMIRVLLAPMGTVLRHACLTGLRPTEAVESARLIINSGGGDMPRYYNPEHQSLEHFLFPDVFLRTTKKAFISFITLDNLQPITLLGPKTPRVQCNKVGMQAPWNKHGHALLQKIVCKLA
jgi:hypothetical protein